VQETGYAVVSIDVITADLPLQAGASQTNFDTSEVLQVWFGDVNVAM